MNDQRDKSRTGDAAGAELDATFEGTRRRQMLLGLELDYAGRLRWLDRRMAELRKLQGRASSRPDEAKRLK